MPVELIYPELSYEIVGSVIDVFKDLGFGYPEKIYQRSLAKELTRRKIAFKKEKLSKLLYKGEGVGSMFYDFVVDAKVILELKVASEIYPSHVKQVLIYLKASGLKLGILAVITPRGAVFKRIVN